MRKSMIIFVTLIILLLLLMSSVSPALGITQATRDTENIYSNVGWFAVDIGEPNYLNVCTGTLIAQSVFLTAAHCLAWNIEIGLDLYVSFDRKMGEESKENKWIKASDFSVHPKFGHDQANLYDLAVIILEEPAGVTPATLTTAGFLDKLSAHGGRAHTDFLSAGYGAQADWEKGPLQFFFRPDATPPMYGAAVYTQKDYDAITMGFQNALFTYGCVWHDANWVVEGVLNKKECVEALEAYKRMYDSGPPGNTNSFFPEMNNYFIAGQATFAMNYFAFLPALANRHRPRLLRQGRLLLQPARPLRRSVRLTGRPGHQHQHLHLG